MIVKCVMPATGTKRLKSKNFRRVDSQAIRSIDFVAGKALEIEFTDGEVYHYHKTPERFWKHMLKLIETGGSLGTYVNRDFKKEVDRLGIKYGQI